MPVIRTLLCFLPLLFLPVCAWALQTVHVEDGDTVSVTISQSETTRIAIKEGRIAKVWGAEANLQVLPDTDSGELFVMPLAEASATFSFFIRDNEQRTYTLQATQADLPSETILLVPPKRLEAPASLMPAALKDEPYVQRIKRLIKGMARKQAVIEGFQRTKLNEPVPLWQEAQIVLTARFLGHYLTGEIYRFTNTSQSDMVLAESEFLTFGQHVKAVAIENMTLLPEQTTIVYVVRGR